MAQQTTVQLVDDLDGSKADETVTFSLDGVDFEVDVSAANAARLREGMADYVLHARRVGGRLKRGTAPTGGTKAFRPDAGQVRAWANANGFEVSPRGRIRIDVVAAYEAAKTAEQKPNAKAAARKPPAKAPARKPATKPRKPPTPAFSTAAKRK